MKNAFICRLCVLFGLITAVGAYTQELQGPPAPNGASDEQKKIIEDLNNCSRSKQLYVPYCDQHEKNLNPKHVECIDKVQTAAHYAFTQLNLGNAHLTKAGAIEISGKNVIGTNPKLAKENLTEGQGEASQAIDPFNSCQQVFNKMSTFISIEPNLAHNAEGQNCKYRDSVMYRLDDSTHAIANRIEMESRGSSELLKKNDIDVSKVKDRDSLTDTSRKLLNLCYTLKRSSSEEVANLQQQAAGITYNGNSATPNDAAKPNGPPQAPSQTSNTDKDWASTQAKTPPAGKMSLEEYSVSQGNFKDGSNLTPEQKQDLLNSYNSYVGQKSDDLDTAVSQQAQKEAAFNKEVSAEKTSPNMSMTKKSNTWKYIGFGALGVGAGVATGVLVSSHNSSTKASNQSKAVDYDTRCKNYLINTVHMTSPNIPADCAQYNGKF